MSWTSRGADEVRIEPDVGTVPATGSLAICPLETTTYRITATRDGTSIADTAAVTAIDPSAEPTATLSATQESIVRGNASILSWTSSNADSLTIEPDIGTVNQNGSRTIPPTQTTIYTLAASGPGGDVASTATVEVRLPSPISLQITYPVDGAEIAGAAVSVKEAVGNENGLETAVVVNGVLAIVAEGQFIADNV